MKQFLLKGAAACALALVLVLSGCPGTGGGDTTLDKDALNVSITAAVEARSGVQQSNDGTDVAPSGEWVIPAVWSTFDAAIKAAEKVRDNAGSQSEIDSAKTALDYAITVFKSQKKLGTLDKSALNAEIIRAQDALKSVQKSTNGKDVSTYLYWVTEDQWNTLQNAVNTAISARDNAGATSVTLASAETMLANALTGFNSQKQPGTKASGFTADELSALINMANAAKAGVESSNGPADNIAPGKAFVSAATMSALETAITNAENTANIEASYTALGMAYKAFNEAIRYGTVPNKTPLQNAITNANTARDSAVTAASAADAPQGSSWATQAQKDTLSSAITAAQGVYSNDTATQNQVSQATATLTSAVTAFTNAVNANGTGTRRGASITITGIPAGISEISLGLFANEDDIYLAVNSEKNPDVVGDSSSGVINGSITLELLQNVGHQPWAGTGEWIAGFMGDNGKLYITSQKLNFGNSPNPTVSFGNCRNIGWRFMLSEIAEDYPGSGLEQIYGSTLDQIIQATNGVNYAALIAQMGNDYRIYHDKFLTNEFKGSDRLNKDTVYYMPINPYQNIGGNGGGGGKLVGKLSGQILLDNPYSAPPRVYIEANSIGGGDGQNWWGTSRQLISLNGTGQQTINWEIPIYEEDVQDFGSGQREMYFALGISDGNSSFYIDMRDTTFTLNSSDMQGTNFDKKCGLINSGNPVSIAYITLSGTVTASLQSGQTFQYLSISAYISVQNASWNGGTTLRTGATNAAWTILLPAAASGNTGVLFSFYPYNQGADGGNLGDAVTFKNITVGNVSNINLGNIIIGTRTSVTPLTDSNPAGTSGTIGGVAYSNKDPKDGQTYYLLNTTFDAALAALTTAFGCSPSDRGRVGSGGSSLMTGNWVILERLDYAWRLRSSDSDYMLGWPNPGNGMGTGDGVMAEIN